MANELDDINGPVMAEGRQINVIAKTIPVKVGIGTRIFDLAMWLWAVPGLFFLLKFAKVSKQNLYIGLGLTVVGIIVTVVYQVKKVHAGNYLLQTEQKIQHDASQIDNYLEQRVQILMNTAVLVEKSINLDKTVFTELAALRTSGKMSDAERNEYAGKIAQAQRNINVAVENYPQLGSQETIRKAMNDNSYLQKEITAAREVYNDAVLRWNTAIFEWPCKMIAAANRKYTTRIPFIADQETKDKARSVFF